MTNPLLVRWIEGDASPADEVVLHAAGDISDCEFEFGPHDDHSDCERIMADMNPEPPYNDAPYTPYTFYDTRI